MPGAWVISAHSWQWCSGVVLQWRSGVVLQWCGGVVLQWCGGAVVWWWCGAVVRECYTKVVLVLDSIHELHHCVEPHPCFFVRTVLDPVRELVSGCSYLPSGGD